MRRFSLFAVAVAAVIATAGARAEEKRHTTLPRGTQVILVGRVSSPPKGALNEKKMQVALGRPRSHVDYTLHFGDAVVLSPQGAEIDEDRLDEGQWVRAEGTVMENPRRIKVSRMRVISPNDRMRNLKGSPYYRPGHPHGYLMWPAGPARVAGVRHYYRSKR